MTKISVNPFCCVLCGKHIGARSSHVILSAESSLSDATVSEQAASAAAIACRRCMDARGSHAALYPACDVAGCDLYDHAHNLCAGRAAAHFALTNLGRMATEQEGATHTS